MEVNMSDVAPVTTVTETGLSVKKIKFEFTSGEGTYAGTASDSTANTYSGKLIWAVIDPGSTAPTADWDLTITDADSIDLLGGNGVDCSATATEYIAESSLGSIDGGVITFNVTNAGDQKTGTVYVWIR
jgi:hypothetical protein